MRSGLKTVRAVVVLACVSLFLTGCGGSPQDKIVGKWEAGEAGAKVTAEFAKDGKATLTMPMLGTPVQGTYKISGDDLEWTSNGITTKYKVKVTGSELQLTTEGKTITYKKV